MALCSYTILPESPEVLVIEDLSVDPRSRDNVYVTGPAKLRFYAGAALTVAGVRVGTLCIQDTVPRHEFDIEQRRNLLDLGESHAIILFCIQSISLRKLCRGGLDSNNSGTPRSGNEGTP